MALKLQYANSVIPIETVALLDTTVLTSIYSHADKSYGGGKTIDVTGIAVNNNFTTSSIAQALGTAAVNNVIFLTPTLLPVGTTSPPPLKGLGVFIKKAGSSGTPVVEATGIPDVIILLGTSVVTAIEIKISGIGDGIFLPLNSVAQTSISIKSSAPANIALVEIIAIY